jgi:hypothetical protein
MPFFAELEVREYTPKAKSEQSAMSGLIRRLCGLGKTKNEPV